MKPALLLPAPVLLGACLLLLVGGLSYLGIELSRLQGLSREHQTRAAKLDLELTQTRLTLERSRADVARLEGELRGQITRQEELTKAVNSQQEKLLAARLATNEARAKAMRPMPAGVRLTLVKINKLLRQDGYESFRFIWSRELGDHELKLVELIETDVASLKKSFFMSERVTLLLNRASSQLTIHLHGGYMLNGEGSLSIPATGHMIVLDSVDGPTWETQLPQIVTAEGAYPQEILPPPQKTFSRAQVDDWIERIDHVLSLAKTPVRYRCERIRGLEGGRFQHAVLLGYKAKILASSAEAKNLEFRIDPRAGTVSLILSDGLLRKKGGQTSIPASGYRILLPGLTGAEVSKAMMGMVIRK